MDQATNNNKTGRLNPFPGLRPFEKHEAHLFFGRDGQSEALLQRITKTRFLAVVGASGSGKSSLVRAGFLPALHGGYRELGQWSWRMGIVRPGMDPIGNLAKTLIHPGTLNDEVLDPGAQWNPDLLEAGMMETVLRRGSRGLVEAIQEAKLLAHERFVLLVDQFEELFTYQEERKDVVAREDVSAFVRLLLESTRKESSPIFVVITMRSDYLGDCAQFRDLPEALNQGQYLIPRMTREERQQAIEGPAAVGNGVFEPALVQRVLNDVGDDPDQLPILQHALMCTWDQWAKETSNGQSIKFEQYEAIGGFEKALDKHANGAYLSLPDDRARKQAEKLFKCLTKKDGENRGVRRPLSINTIAEITGVNPKDLEPIIRVFQINNRNFLVETGKSPKDGSPIIDISHESLIRNWAKLSGNLNHKGWVEEEAESRANYLRIVDAARRKQKDEGGLWRDPDLTIAFKWKAENDPNQAWAGLYAREFEINQAFSFLDQSQKKQKEEVESQEGLRRRAILGLVIGLLLAILFGSIAGVQWWKASYALKKLKVGVHLAAVSQIEKDPTLGALLMAELGSEELSRGAITTAQQLLHNSLAQTVLKGHDLGVKVGSISPDGIQVVTASDDGTARVWRMDGTGMPVVMRGHESAITDAAFSPDGTRVVTASDDGTARVWRVDGTGTPVVLRGHEDYVTSAMFSPDGAHVVTASTDSTVRVWRVDGAGMPVVMRGHESAITDVAFSPDGTRVVTASDDGTARVWRVDGTGTPVVLRGHEDYVTSAMFSPDGAHVVTASTDSTVRVWRVDGAGMPVVMRGHESAITDVAFSPDGTRVVTASDDGTARVWRVDGTGTPVVLRGHNSAITDAAFDPDGTRVVTASDDGTARVWRVDGTGTPVELRGHEDAITSVAFSPDGTMVMTTSNDGTARVWPTKSLGVAVELIGHSDGVWRTAFSPNGAKVVTGSFDGTARVWRVDGTGTSVELRGHEDSITDTAFSPDGAKVVTASDDGTARVWRVDGTGTPVELRGHEDYVTSAKFSPDGAYVVTASADSTARVWRVDGTGTPVELRGHEDAITDIAFSPDGTKVVTASADSTARVWQADGSGTPVELRGHEDAITDTAFSPDGAKVVTASDDGTARVWRVDGTGTPVELRGHEDYVTSAKFSPDGAYVVTASADSTARVWRVDGMGEPLVLLGHLRGLWNASFFPDGERLITVSEDRTARLWPFDKDRIYAPLVLKGHRERIWHGRISQDGTTVVTASDDGTARIWYVGRKENELLKALSNQTTSCLTNSQRIRYLSEEKEEAQKKYEACERQYGRIL